MHHIIRQNRLTRFLAESPQLGPFRAALADADDDDTALLEAFRTAVPLTDYDVYEPFIARLVAHRPRDTDVTDMFAPDMPAFVAVSSATSGKRAKLFPKYAHPSNASLQAVDEHANPAGRSGKNCVVYSLNYQQIVDVVGHDNATVARFPVTSMSSGVVRMQHGLTVDRDPWLLSLKAPRATSPMAVSFIANYRSFLLTHLLFALAEPHLGTITTLFGTVFLDMVHYMEEEWEALIDSIDSGMLPHWHGTDHVRQYLQPRFLANPGRAAHLRAVGKATERPGWFKQLWPDLVVVVGIASGVFSAIIPKMQHYLGPDIRMSSLGFTASEAYIGTALSSDLGLFKATDDDVIEYLDVSKPETASSLVFGHQVQIGRRYEIVVTTRDGLWRYRLGDVIEIAGFDPDDGSPILRYIERRGGCLRLPNALISEAELTSAVLSAQDVLGHVTEFTVFVADRMAPSSLAFCVELDGTLSALSQHAPARIASGLCHANDNVRAMCDRGQFAPTVHVLKRGTFREYRALRVEAAVTGTGQVKVPVVLWDRDAQAWMLHRVERVIAHRPGP